MTKRSDGAPELRLKSFSTRFFALGRFCMWWLAAALGSAAFAADTREDYALPGGFHFDLAPDPRVATSAIKGNDKTYTVEFSRRYAALVDRYVATYIGVTQAAFAESQTALPSKQPLPIGGFDVALNSADLAGRALGMGRSLPFSNQFLWGGIGLGLTSMLLSGNTVTDRNIALLKSDMASLQGPFAKAYLVTVLKPGDPRLNDKTTLLLNDMERMRVLLEQSVASCAWMDKAPKSVLIQTYIGWSDCTMTLAPPRAVRVQAEFVSAKSVWRNADPTNEVLVTTAVAPISARGQEGYIQAGHIRDAMLAQGIDGLYVVWTTLDDGRIKTLVGGQAEAGEFETPPPAAQWEQWLKSKADAGKAAATTPAS